MNLVATALPCSAKPPEQRHSDQLSIRWTLVISNNADMRRLRSNPGLFCCDQSSPCMSDSVHKYRLCKYLLHSQRWLRPSDNGTCNLTGAMARNLILANYPSIITEWISYKKKLGLFFRFKKPNKKCTEGVILGFWNFGPSGVCAPAQRSGH